MSRLPRRGALRLLSRVLVVAVTGWLACIAAILIWSTRDSTERADAIIVLGAAQYGGRPSPVLRARLDHALNLWSEQRAPRIIFTGGRREGDLISEAAAGRRFASRRGVPPQAILLEAAGRTTLASMHGAAVLLHQRTDSTAPPLPARPRVLLVSDPFHMLRLDVLARLHGLSPLPSPTRTSPISANRSVALEYMLRESIALPTDVLLLLWLHMTGHSRELVADG
jgi:uncharacterized SAM-binding protein YcdF (DUF218 family)